MGWLKAAFKGIKGVGKFVKHGVKGLISKKANSNNPLQGFQNTGFGGSNIAAVKPVNSSNFFANIGSWLEKNKKMVGLGLLGGLAIFKGKDLIGNQPRRRRRR
jgi:hypothetical protein